jgi:Protein of unknown function (DUF1360)
MALFSSLVAAALFAVRRSDRQLPERIGAADLITIGVASHKLGRVIAKDKVTSPLRAPFTELEGSGGPSELEETSRGTGIRKAIEELLACPYCLGLWVITAFSFGLLFEPEPEAVERVRRLGVDDDGLWTHADPEAVPEILDAYRGASEDAGREPGEIVLQAAFSWAQDDEAAMEGARVWKGAQPKEFFKED